MINTSKIRQQPSRSRISSTMSQSFPTGNDKSYLQTAPAFIESSGIPLQQYNYHNIYIKIGIFSLVNSRLIKCTYTGEKYANKVSPIARIINVLPSLKQNSNLDQFSQQNVDQHRVHLVYYMGVSHIFSLVAIPFSNAHFCS